MASREEIAWIIDRPSKDSDKGKFYSPSLRALAKADAILAASKDEMAHTYTGCAVAPVAWIVKWTTVHTPENASAYLNEADAQRAAANVRMYAHASSVVVIPTFVAPAGTPAQPAPVRVTNEMIDAAVEAAWPGPEIVYDDNFDGPKAMMRAALEAALSLPSTDRE